MLRVLCYWGVAAIMRLRFLYKKTQRQNGRRQVSEKLAAAVLNVFKWETVYRRAVSYSRGVSENSFVWKTFAAYSSNQLDRAVEQMDLELEKFKRARFE